MELEQILQYIFWFCVIIVLYSYLGYGLIVWVIIQTRMPRKKITPDTSYKLPSVAILIAAYNEEDCIADKISNTLALDYPPEKFSIHIVTDGSTDNTTSISRSYSQVTTYHQDKREGKVAAMQRIVQMVDAEILLFTDANCHLQSDALKLVIPYFYDPKIGGVSGEKKVTGNQEQVEATEGIYWKYESWLKCLDAKLNTIVGAAGELLAVRSNLFRMLPEDTILDDFMQSMLICAKGFKIAYEPRAAAIEPPSLSLMDEMERKTRIAAGAFQSMERLNKVKGIWTQPLLAFQYISHRVTRWTIAPLALPLILISNAVLLFTGSGTLYIIAFACQLLFYLTAFGGYLYYIITGSTPGIMKIPLYFVMMNLAVFKGFFRYKNNVQTMLWKKAPRNNNISGKIFPTNRVP